MELVRWALPTQFDGVLEFGIAGGLRSSLAILSTTRVYQKLGQGPLPLEFIDKLSVPLPLPPYLHLPHLRAHIPSIA